MVIITHNFQHINDLWVFLSVQNLLYWPSAAAFPLLLLLLYAVHDFCFLFSAQSPTSILLPQPHICFYPEEGKHSMHINEI